MKNNLLPCYPLKKVIFQSIIFFGLLSFFFSCQKGAPTFDVEKELVAQFLERYQMNDLIILEDSSNIQLDTLIQKLYALQPYSDQYLMQAILVKANDLSNLLDYRRSNELIFNLFDKLNKTDRDTSVRFIFAELHSLLGYNFDRLQKYSIAINHYEKSRLLYEEEQLAVEAAGQLGNQCLSYIGIGDFEKAMEVSDIGKYILDTISRPNMRALQLRMHNKMARANAYNFRSKQLFEMGRYKEMKVLLSQVINTYKSLIRAYENKENIPPQIYIFYGGLASSYNLLASQEPFYADSSIYYLEKIIPVYREGKTKVIQPELLSIFQATLAFNYLLKEKEALAFNSIEDALYSLDYYKYKEKGTLENIDQFHPFPLYLAFVLGIKGTIGFKYYQKTKQVELLKENQEIFKESCAIINRVSLDYTSKDLLTAHRARVDDIFRNYSFTYLELFRLTKSEKYFEKALHISEQYKNLVLRNRFNRQLLSYQYNNERGVFLQKEQALQKRRKRLTHKLKADFSNRLSIIDSLLLLQKDENIFLDELKNSNSTLARQYYKSRYEVSMPNLSDLRKELGDNKAIITYHFSGPSPVVMVITPRKNGYQLLEDINEEFYETVEKLMKEDFPHENKKNYTEHAYEIHEKLFSKIDVFIDSQINELIIIPDNILRGLPFEALLYEKPVEGMMINDYPFLVNKYAISYVYALSTYELSEQVWQYKKDQNRMNFVAFNASPDAKAKKSLGYYEGCNLTPLNYLTGIADDIAKLFPKEKQKVFTKARKQDFVEQAPTADILYLAMHGCTSNRAPLDYGLQFMDKKEALLTVNEILDLSLNAQLVVLGSCDTESGQASAGEGIASIARAFHRSGCLNMIASQNVVNDKFGAFILEDFYYNWIVKGDNTAQALAKAKRTFLKRNDFKTGDKFPSKWAGLISIGKPILWQD